MGRPAPRVFEEAQRLTQWHYQWVVAKDFLPKIVGQNVVDSVLNSGSANAPPRADLLFYKPTKNPFMPVEFSVAAYRFGHSQIRPGYRLGQGRGAALFQAEAGQTNLNGGRPLTDQLRIEWENFFDVPGNSTRAQPSKFIDTRISGPLFDLPTSIVPADETPRMPSLVERNLRRGKALGLPSGQGVAREMAAKGAPIDKVFSNAELGMPSDPGWHDEAPLWFSILKEAELQHGGRRLGDVGGRIVAEVFVGLLAEDPFSFLNRRPDFEPQPPIASSPGEFRMSDLLKFAGAA